MIQKAELFVLPAHMSATDLHQSLKRSAIIILSVAQVSSHEIGILLNLKAGTRLEALIKLLLDNSALIVLIIWFEKVSQRMMLYISDSRQKLQIVSG